jgi:hypothetical protein
VGAHRKSRTGFLVAQTVFFVHHLGFVFLLCAHAASKPFGNGRLARGGAWLAVVGMVGLTLAELNAMRYADWDFQKANESAMGAVYGISCNLIGLGMLIAGVGVIRARVWTRWRRWMPLVVGIATFVELMSGMFGGFVIARLAIATWMLLLGALGMGLRIEAHRMRGEIATAT